jgi:hypothetical protein
VKVTIDVTQEDINDGEPGTCWGCPIALAASRALPYAEDVSVGADMLTVGEYDADLPMLASDFVHRFDNGKPTGGPFAFEVELPDVLAEAVAK